MTFADFHFLRPEWLWALIPAAVIGVLLLRNRAHGASEGWAKLVDTHLLQHLAISGAQGKRSRALPVAGFITVVVTIAGLAGPTWQQSDVPSFEGGEPVVAVLSLAQSMNADDLTPTRLKRSVHKLRDILERTQGDERGLVIYSDAPFVAAPLTSDPKVIEQMLPELSTNLMPVLGNRLDLAISEAQAMLERGGAARGQIVVMADDAGNNPEASVNAAKVAKRAGFTVSVLGAGTEEGATLQTADGRAIASQDGQTFMAKLSIDTLEQIASAGGGTFSMITPGGTDLDLLLPDTVKSGVAAGDRQDFQADAWLDMGYWLLILPVLLIPLTFRRGLVFGLAVVVSGIALQPNAARAGTWDNLWATPDQQGQTAFDSQEFAGASELFEQPEWQASAAYRAGNYAAATKGFAMQDHNLGNALAKSGQFEAALASYDAALEQNPDDADAKFNRDLIAKLLEQQEQEQQEQDQQQQDQQQESGEQSQDQQSQGSESEPQDGSEQQQSEGSETDQQEGSEGQEQQAESKSQEGEQQAEDAGTEQQGSESETSEQQGSEQSESKEQSAQEQGAQEQGAEQSGDEQQAGAEPQEADAPKPEEHAENETAAGQEPSETEEKGLSDMLSDLLNGSEGQEPQEMVEGSAPGAQPIDQAVEQQLRRVPDDPSGLLRARIRQHYARAQSGN